MAISSAVLSHEVNFADRLVPSLERMLEVVQGFKDEGRSIVLTSGSFDLIHLGHAKYLAKAKEFGDVLVVGVDSDTKIRSRKGEGRPMVPEQERLEMLAHQRPVDLLFLKDQDEERWGLIKAVRPDVLVLSEDHAYSEEDQRTLLNMCQRIEVLERQASVTTSERIRQMYLHLGERIGPSLADVLGPSLADSLRPMLADELRPLLARALPGLIDEVLRR